MARQIELLAPAKELACGVAAINHGADAVYVGAPQFSARAAAPVALKEIEQLCRYAHQYHARVHVALNTILTDAEIETAQQLITDLYHIGIDALIIQDVGLLELDLPPIPIHASTQTDNRSVERVLFWEKMGLQRVILARELSLKQIEEIRAATAVELECFVHGALCVSYSGQCYMSQACAQRSANRGNCAQFCRLPFTLLDANRKVIKRESHLLSLKDMNRIASLHTLMQAGITSFKIEGRLKNIDYVKNITALYRQAIDKILAGKDDFQRASSGITTICFTPNARKTFSRGETEYFLHQREPIMVDPDTPKSMGEPIGKVTFAADNRFKVTNGADLNHGDGLSFLDEQGDLQGFRINKIENGYVHTLERIDALRQGTMLYRNYDATFAKSLTGKSAIRKVAVQLLLQETEKGFMLCATDEDSVTAELAIESCKEPARNEGAARDALQKNLSKMGDTIFNVTDVIVETTRPYFFSPAVINQWRRTIADLLLERRIQAHSIPKCVLRKDEPIPFPNQGNDRLGFTGNVLNRKAVAFYQRHGIKDCAPAFEAEAPEEAIVMTCKHCIRYTLGECPQQMQKAHHNHPTPWYLQHHHFLFQLEFDCAACEMIVRTTKK